MALTIKSSRWVAADLAVHFVRDAALGIGAAVTAFVNRRQAARALAKFDGRMLADIGLTRTDVESAFAEPIWRDPTTRLAVIAIERRSAARQAAQGKIEAGKTGTRPRLELVN